MMLAALAVLAAALTATSRSSRVAAAVVAPEPSVVAARSDEVRPV